MAEEKKSLFDNKMLMKYYDNMSYSDIFENALDGFQQIGNASIYEAQGKLSSSKYNMVATINDINANRMAANVEDITRAYDDNLNAVKMSAVQTKGRQIEAMSSSGFKVDSGSYIDITNQTDYMASKMAASLTVAYQSQLAENKFQSRILGIQSALNRVNAETELRLSKQMSKASTIGGAFSVIKSLGDAGLKYGLENKDD